jgi:molybdopterin synthase sulfur carrier subunit
LGTVKLYATLRDRAGGRRDIEVPWSAGEPVITMIRRLIEQAPGLEGQVLDQDGTLLPFVSVFLNGRDIRYLGGLDTPFNGSQEVAIFPAVAGGVG